MNLVIISALNPPPARYLIHKIQTRWPVKRVIRPIYAFKSSSPSRWTRIRNISANKIRTLPQMMFYNWQTNQLNTQIKQLLFGNSNSPQISDYDEVLRSAINSEEIVQHIQSLDPDILLVCMAPILKPAVFTIPKLATVNIHFGIAPYYRGEHTLFWPLYFGDYENIGITLHLINRGIDSGHILAQGFPAIEKYDTEASLWAKSSQLAANIVLDFLEAAQNGNIQGRQQESKGRLFLSKDRKMRYDIHYFLKKNIFRQYPPSYPQRINKYF